jgi:hypothetical protein
MPAYLVELQENEKMTLPKNMKLGKLVVWAEDVAQAKSVAKSWAEGDSNAAWDNATVTDLSTAQTFADLVLNVLVEDLGGTPDADIVVETVMPDDKVVASGTIDTAGTGYSENDILTPATGTKTRAATFRVTAVGGSGEVEGIELVDPGDRYTVDPTLDGVATTVLPDNGSGCELDLVMDLNATAIDGALVDMATPILQVAAIADDIGDRMLTAKFYNATDPTKQALTGLLSTVVDEGDAAAVLTVLLVATPTAGAVLAAL